MSRRDAIVLASRTLALLLMVWALTEVSYLPALVHAFVHHSREGHESSVGSDYLHHYYLIVLSFTITRIIGYSLLGRWLFRRHSNPQV